MEGGKEKHIEMNTYTCRITQSKLNSFVLEAFVRDLKPCQKDAVP